MCEDGEYYGNCGSCKSKPAEKEGNALTEAYIRGREVGAEITEKKLKDLQKQLADATLKATALERKLMGLQAK